MTTCTRSQSTVAVLLLCGAAMLAAQSIPASGTPSAFDVVSIKPSAANAVTPPPAPDGYYKASARLSDLLSD